LALSAASAVLLGSQLVLAGETVTFQHQDARYLLPDQSEGGLAYVPDTVTDPATPVPLVVFLHGMNPEGALHLWFGGGGYDLRDHLEQVARANDTSFVVAAPSNTRRAGYYKNLWHGFNTADFVEDTARAVDALAVIDEDRVFVVGHSAAGCNLHGGLLTAAAAEEPVHVRGLLLIDTCLDGDVAHRIAARSRGTRLWVTWQDVTWPREPGVFFDVVDREEPPGAWFRMQKIDTASSRPHTSVVLPSLLRMLRLWILQDQPSPDLHPIPRSTPHPAPLRTATASTPQKR
jgi:hypothetical protein